MSPLARSLLALGALLAAADAWVTPLNEPPGSPCNGFIMGTLLQVPSNIIADVTFEFKAYDRLTHKYSITNHCKALKAEIATERVEVCNIYQHPTMELFPPDVKPLGDTVMSPVYASCRDNEQCGPMRFNITQRCMQS